jgi:AcrR family transcriptional regulator
VSEPKSRAAKRAATAQRILDAARAEFGEHGLEGGTIRAIARRANVDPSLVMQHYGSKAALFAVAIQLDGAGTGDIEAHLHDVLDVRLAALPPETKALVRSMLTAPEAAASMSAFLNERVANLSRAMGGDDADLRAALIVSSILGLTIARHFLKLDALTNASDADIARVARPWVTTGVDPAGSTEPPTRAALRGGRREGNGTPVGESLQPDPVTKR